MRRHVLTTALVMSGLAAGCGARPAALSPAAFAPVQTATQAATGALKVSALLMPPMTVFKTADDADGEFLAGLKQAYQVDWADVSPVMHTVRFTLDGQPVGYLVTVHGNASISKSDGPKQPLGFLISYLIDANAQLSYSHTLYSVATAGRDQQIQPTRVANQRLGDLYLMEPQGKALPPAVQTAVDALHTSEQQALSQRFAPQKLAPTDPTWWRTGTTELHYKDRMIGYYDDPAAWMWSPTDATVCQRGLLAVNVLDPSAAKLYAGGYADDPTNIAGYTNFSL